MMEKLKIDSLCYAYESENVVRGVSMYANDGEFVGIISKMIKNNFMKTPIHSGSKPV